MWRHVANGGTSTTVCARCGGRVSSWDMTGRTCYACEGDGCQPKSKLPLSDGDNSKKSVKKEKEKEEVQKKNNHVVATATEKRRARRRNSHSNTCHSSATALPSTSHNDLSRAALND